MLGAGAGAGCRVPAGGVVSWLCTWWRQVAGAGAGRRVPAGGVVSWLCTWWRQVAGAGAGRRCWCCELAALHAVETGCWCWPGAGAPGCARLLVLVLAVRVVETGCWCWCREPVLVLGMPVLGAGAAWAP